MARSISVRPTFFVVLVLTLFWSQISFGQSAREAAALGRAMEEMRSGNWDGAAQLALPSGQAGRDVIEWFRLREGLGTFDESLAFLARNPDWPGLRFLRRKAEANLPFGQRADKVIVFFGDDLPQTGAGSAALAEALSVTGRDDMAASVAKLAWTTQRLSKADENILIKNYGEVLKPLHTERLDMLLWLGRRSEAERMYPRVSEGWQKLAAARLDLRGKKPGVDARIAAVPKALKSDPGLAYERAAWRFGKGRYESAAELLLERDGTEEALGEPQRWSNMRRVLARDAMRDGEGRKAYRLASQHGLTEGSAYADLEWLSGYLALRYLDDADTARRHFRAFRAAVVTPISLGRAGYWEGRAEEALGNDEAAAAAYAFGAEYQTSFYGLLAAERAGIAMDPALTGRAAYPDWESQPFAESSVLKAALLLQRAGERSLAERFMAHLAESLTEEQIGSLADLALELEEPHIALMIAKRAATMGITVPRPYYPVVDIGASNPAVPTELALSIARRESEFDPVVVSGAGARGLMQLMPRTAQQVSGELGIKYTQSRLTSDPVYNARLGVAYLAELLDEFDGNAALSSAGYNAGPSRPRRWINLYGDPRAPDVDPVDWVEHIPFRETRNYVMRVMESLPVYRARLSGDVAPIRLTEELKAR